MYVACTTARKRLKPPRPTIGVRSFVRSGWMDFFSYLRRARFAWLLSGVGWPLEDWAVCTQLLTARSPMRMRLPMWGRVGRALRARLRTSHFTTCNQPTATATCKCMMLHRLPHIAFVPNKLTFSEDYLGTLLEFKKKIFLGRGAQQLGCHVRDRRLVRGQR